VVPVLTQLGAAVAQSNEARLREHILHDYDKSQWPDNDVLLTYDIFYVACPNLDPAAATVFSEVSEVQVSLTTLFFSV